VTTLKYPPLGGRSWGPVRGAELLELTLEAYRTSANANCIVLAMIETRKALGNLDAILATPGLDGVFVGPSDLSISLSNGAALNHAAEGVIDALKLVVARAAAVGKITAAFCPGGAVARRNAEIGIDLLAVGSDWGFLTDGARAALAAARGIAAENSARGY
jgi:4-hydroxy-2-oxoheptanedioate aldolase